MNTEANSPKNITPHAHLRSRKAREEQKGHRGKVIWFTGLSGSGKSTIADALDQLMSQSGYFTSILDGDNLRHGLNSDLSFSPEDRLENLRRAAQVSRIISDNGTIVLSAFISPLNADRELITSIVGVENIIWVYVDCPLSVCEARDPKQLYKKARKGIIPNFTGISAPFEAPERPMFTAKSDQYTPEAIAKELLANFADTIAL
ncbi:MAG: adenylyl-sulfate kinase [Flavobacteriales bacterium]|jgi:adenylyl-sulfate kinase